jgi:hypothetical protein
MTRSFLPNTKTIAPCAAAKISIQKQKELPVKNSLGNVAGECQLPSQTNIKTTHSFEDQVID